VLAQVVGGVDAIVAVELASRGLLANPLVNVRR